MASLIEDSNEHEVCDDSFSTIQGSSSLMRSISLNSTLNSSAPSFTRPNNTESYVVEMVDLDLNCEELEHSSPSSASLPSTPSTPSNDSNNTAQSNQSTNLSFDRDPLPRRSGS